MEKTKQESLEKPKGIFRPFFRLMGGEISREVPLEIFG